jgi:hypothetical protein
MRHHQISQGIDNKSMMYAHCFSPEYNQGNTTILSNGRPPTKGRFHWAVTAGLPNTKVPFFLFLRQMPMVTYS